MIALILLLAVAALWLYLMHRVWCDLTEMVEEYEYDNDPTQTPQ